MSVRWSVKTEEQILNNLHGGPDTTVLWYVVMDGFIPVARVRSFKTARLIASAPEMQACLEAVYHRRAPQLNFDFEGQPDMIQVQRLIELLRGDV